jgi:hypothetical protein
MQWRTILLASAGCVVATTVAMAQQAIGQGSAGGRVTDPSGAVIAGAEVETRHLDTNRTQTTTTDSDGRFRFPYLPVGTYDIVVRHPGFADRRHAIVVLAGSAFDLPLALDVEGVSAGVTVTASASVLEAARSQVAATVPEAEVRRLPLNGRQFLDIALLAPGVAPPNINSTQLFAETSAVPGVGLSIGGQRNLSNSVVVDGLSSNDDAAGLSGMPYGVDAVEQVQVVTSGAQAELGRAIGGYVNVVTRSGTNRPHGTAYGYFRDDRLNARNALSGTTLPMSQQQYGGSLGGPIRRDRTFFFANVEARRLEQTGLTTIDPTALAAIEARLRVSGYPGTLPATGEYVSPVDSRHVLGKVEHVVSTRHQLGVRYSLYDVTANNARGAGGLSAPSASAGLDNRDQAVALSSTQTWSTRTVNETRVQYTDSSLRAPSTDLVGPAVNIAGVATFGTFSSSPQGRFNRMLQLVDNVSQQRGAHALRAGVDLVHNADRIVFPRAARGSYAFSSLANFLAGTYNNAGHSQTFGATEVTQAATAVGVFVQDAWSATPALTVNLGLRYDLQFLETIATDADNLAPRLGMAWVPTASRRLVIRVNAGRFFDRVPLRAVANALLSAGNTTDLAALRQTSVGLSPGQAGGPVFPAVLPAPVPTVTLVNLMTMDRALQNAASTQASVEVERQLSATATVTAAYSYIAGRDLLMAINQNVPSCVPAGGNNGCRPNPAYANDSRYVSAGSSATHALSLTLQQRASRWGTYRATYTLSRARNDVGEFFFSGPIDPFDVSKDWARADSDRRHVLVVSGSVESPDRGHQSLWHAVTSGWQASALLLASSAAPFTITSGTTTVQGTSARPIVDGAFIRRNTGVGDQFVALHVRVARAFRVATAVRAELALELFNTTNAVNEIARNSTFGTGTYPTSPSTSFGQVTAVGEPRTAQLSVRLRF